MNTFQRRCWEKVEAILREFAVQCAPPAPVTGKSEDYLVAKFQAAGSDVELYLYSNEAGLSLQGGRWIPFEAPDYRDQEALIEAVGARLRQILGRSG